ncbi:MAG: hypothetical protein A2901_02915 [Elusimicrobia bacterium RIFCSPLOWO2_01_FULL_54_10]|nr:MAG: hypothetical protein A2901_02915 [Elusimicrobia bacterium RIFCSPLOWO2_01_FULL_54_10]
MQKNNVFWLLLALALPACSRGDNKVIAKAGPVRITARDLSAEFENSPDNVRSYLSTLEGKKQFLDIILREKILVNAAERSGVIRRKEVSQSLKNYRDRMKEQETEYRKGLILREYLRDLRDTELKVEDAELKAYYDSHKEDFVKPVRVTASHILTPTQEESQKVLARLKNGEDFAKVAREMSKDPSAERGGIIQDGMGEPARISKGDYLDLPDFEAALFGLKVGKISGVVKTKIGFHVIKKTGEMALPEQTYDQAAPQIHKILERKKFDDWVERSKKEQKVWIDEAALTALPVGRAEPAAEAVTAQ